MRLPMYQAARNSLLHSSEASQFSVTRQATTRLAPSLSRSASAQLVAPGMLSWSMKTSGTSFALNHAPNALACVSSLLE